MNHWQIKALMFGSKWLFKPFGAALLSQHTVISQKWSESGLQVSHRHECGMKGYSEQAGLGGWGWVSRPLWGGTRHFPRLLTSPTAEIPPAQHSLPPHTDVCYVCVFWCLWSCANEGELCNVKERERSERRWCFSSHQQQHDESGTAAVFSLSPRLFSQWQFLYSFHEVHVAKVLRKIAVFQRRTWCDPVFFFLIGNKFHEKIKRSRFPYRVTSPQPTGSY